MLSFVARRSAVAPLLVLLGSCSTTKPTAPDEAPSSHPASSISGSAPGVRVEPQTEGFLRPDQIFSILDGSEISYSITSETKVAAGGLAELVDRPVPRSRPVDAFVELGPDGDGPRLRSNPPSKTVQAYFEKASRAFEAGDYESARLQYQRAIEIEPAYFKSYTYLGNTLHLLGDYRAAERVLLRALELNAVDYQAMLFLGDTYLQIGEFDRAKDVLTRSYMFNRNNEAVQERLRVILAKKNLQLRAGRLKPRVRIGRSGGDVTMQFDKDNGLRWLALAACMACWAYEDRCAERATEDDDPLRLAMYRECLINQAASIAIRQSKEDTRIARDERALLAAIEDGFLEAIIFWEVVADVAPLVVYLLPDGVQKDILRYIEKYVFASSRVI